MRNREFRLNPSKSYLIFLAILLLSTMVIWVSLSLPLLIQTLGVLVIGFYGYILIKRYGLLESTYSIKAIQYKEKDTWLIYQQNNWLLAELLGNSTVTGWVSILRFRINNKGRSLSCIILKDSLGEDTYRHLLSVLRMR
jgi:hypothetical protein